MRHKLHVVPSFIIFLHFCCLPVTGSGQVAKHWNTVELNPDWSTPAYWIPFGNPTAIDGAVLGGLPGIENRIVNLDQDVSVASLEILNGMTLQGTYDSLHVNGATIVAGINDEFHHSTLRLGFTGGTGYTFQTSDLSILDGALVHLQANSVANINDQIYIGDNSELRANAVINLFGNGARSLINLGVICARPSGLEIFQHGTGLLDLDGDGTGVIDLTYNFLGNAYMTVHGTMLNDQFDGDLLMVSGASLNMDLAEPWVMASGSHLMVSPGTSNEYAVIDGQALELNGVIQLNESGPDNASWLRLSPDCTFSESSQVNLQQNTRLETTGLTAIEGGEFSLDQGAHIFFQNETVLQAGSFLTHSQSYDDGGVAAVGPTEWDGEILIIGVLRQLGDATVSGSTVVHGGVLDLDGDGSTNWQINNSLNLNLDQIDNLPDGFDGTFELFATLSQLNVNLSDPEAAWIMGGTMNVGNSLHFPVTRVGGSPMVVGGNLNLSGGAVRFNADTTLADMSTLDFEDSDVSLILTGHSVVHAGALVVGDGTFVNAQQGHLVLESGSTISNASLENNGVLEIGSTAGIADVSQFQSSPSANWLVQIGGAVSGTEHDLLLVGNGAAVLGGNLCVQLIDAGNGLFDPTIGDEFTILSAVGGIVGEFDVAPVSIANGNAYQWDVLYGLNEVTLRLADIITNVYLGDVNEDGIVNLLDVEPFVNLLNTGEYRIQADINCDGRVDLLDVDPFVELLTN